MKTKVSIPWYKTALIGGLSGAIVFFILIGVRAQTALTVAAVHANSKLYVGTEVQVTGMVANVHSGTKTVNGHKVPCTRLNLYEIDSKGREGNHYIYVSLPTSDFTSMPVNGGMATITGPLKWPYEIAAIDP
ncbi:MAG: hypothetical protein NTX59_07200 [Elusimicrobia bacterium]|nr:hypothetical protein [Elusimicrobiota bacterium]